MGRVGGGGGGGGCHRERGSATYCALQIFLKFKFKQICAVSVTHPGFLMFLFVFKSQFDIFIPPRLIVRVRPRIWNLF